ncbi:hypothetical protein THASP1DRAFT_25936, partial [Thamnocephalis sphaerospora]
MILFRLDHWACAVILVITATFTAQPQATVASALDDRTLLPPPQPDAVVQDESNILSRSTYNELANDILSSMRLVLSKEYQGAIDELKQHAMDALPKTLKPLINRLLQTKTQGAKETGIVADASRRVIGMLLAPIDRTVDIAAQYWQEKYAQTTTEAITNVTLAHLRSEFTWKQGQPNPLYKAASSQGPALSRRARQYLRRGTSTPDRIVRANVQGHATFSLRPRAVDLMVPPPAMEWKGSVHRIIDRIMYKAFDATYEKLNTAVQAILQTVLKNLPWMLYLSITELIAKTTLCQHVPILPSPGELIQEVIRIEKAIVLWPANTAAQLINAVTSWLSGGGKAQTSSPEQIAAQVRAEVKSAPNACASIATYIQSILEPMHAATVDALKNVVLQVLRRIQQTTITVIRYTLSATLTLTWSSPTRGIALPAGPTPVASAVSKMPTCISTSMELSVHSSTHRCLATAPWSDNKRGITFAAGH